MDFIATYQDRINHILQTVLAEPVMPEQLQAPMRYSVFNGGKRLRPLLVYAAGFAVNASPEQLDIPASAVELIHAYSLIHDDLPAMDNDDLRRGKPTCHKAFDEATAILAGDALQTLAFYTLSAKHPQQLTSEQRLQMIKILAQGSLQMADGQALDLAATATQADLTSLETIHRRKTGALITVSVHLGILAAPHAPADSIQALLQFADCIGLAFQIHDDILDIEGSTEQLGKPQGADQARNQPTYPSVLGLDNARALMQKLYQQGLNYLATLANPATELHCLAQHMLTRHY